MVPIAIHVKSSETIINGTDLLSGSVIKMDALVQEMPLSISSYKDKADFLAAQNDYASLVDASKQRLALQTCSLRDNQTCALLPIRELRTWPTQTYHPLKVVHGTLFVREGGREGT